MEADTYKLVWYICWCLGIVGESIETMTEETSPLNYIVRKTLDIMCLPDDDKKTNTHKKTEEKSELKTIKVSDHSNQCR